jgi:Na+-translocating ferredoxin:NAD+ oxidoreductase RNF subunit RnfB
VNSVLISSVVTLGSVAAGAGIILYFISRAFYVYEDPRIDEVAELLPGANCGGCGYPGCRGLAEALVKAADSGDAGDLNCPPGGEETMSCISKHLGMEVQTAAPTTAIVRCGGTCENAPAKNTYEGPSVCAIAHSLYSGQSGCPTGCLGLGDCVRSCQFDAIYIEETTGLAAVDVEKCTSCGKCVTACPRSVIEIRPRGKRDRRVWINCINTEKGAPAKKNCKTACIACGKCERACPDKFNAITIENNIAYIDFDKCKVCGRCINECPTKCISATFVPPDFKKKEEEKAAASET